MPAWLSQHESISLDPPPTHWRCRPAPLSPEAREFRRELALPTDRPIIMSGHQAAFWHAGIVAKVFALDAIAARAHAATAWVVVDQDVGEPARVRFPTRAPDRGPHRPSRLGASSLALMQPWGADTITGRQPALPPSIHAPEHPALPTIAPAFDAMKAALTRHAGGPTRALQVTRAAMDLLTPVRRISTDRTAIIPATVLARTTLFARLLDLIRRDPDTCARHYNRAVARHPKARLRSLLPVSGGGPELPIWIITPQGTRQPAYAQDLAFGDGDPVVPTLAPRALLMTALLRWAACDLFIHGLGGGLYDPVMQEWLHDWLGINDLAPAVVASATRLLPLVDDSPPTPSEVARARWAAHHARHNPDPTTKRTLAAAVQAARTPAERAARFRQLHAWLADHRARHADHLAALDARAADLATHADLSAIVFDRTWPFPLLPSASMHSLRDQIHAAF